MIDVLFEQRIVQNTALAAEAIWHAVNDAYEGNDRSEGMPLPLAFLILPISFHQRTASVLAAKTQPGALYKALAEDREITVGLQNRMQAMFPRTTQALYLGFDARLFSIDRAPQPQLIPSRKTAPVSHVSEDVRIVLNAAKRVGQAISEMSLVQLSTHLNIRF